AAQGQGGSKGIRRTTADIMIEQKKRGPELAGRPKRIQERNVEEEEEGTKRPKKQDPKSPSLAPTPHKATNTTHSLPLSPHTLPSAPSRSPNNISSPPSRKPHRPLAQFSKRVRWPIVQAFRLIRWESLARRSTCWASTGESGCLTVPALSARSTPIPTYFLAR